MSNFQTRFFVNAAGFHLGFKVEEDEWEKNIENVNYLTQFLSQDDILCLYATLDDNKGKKLKFQNKMNLSENTAEKVVVFYKSNPIIITDDNMFLVQTVAVQASPTTALYHALSNVFVPLFSQSNNNSTNTIVQKQLADLQVGLRNLANITNDDSSKQGNENEVLTVIQNLDHELEYWKNKSEASATKKDAQKCLDVSSVIQQLSDNFRVLEALPLPEIEDVLENAHNSLDDLWRLDVPYPKARMQHLMDLIAFDLVKCLSKHVKNSNVWSQDFTSVFETLNLCISTGEHWLTTCKQLTEIYWPNYSLHVWNGKSHVPSNLQALVERLKEVLNVRTVHRQIVRLLTSSEVEDLRTNETFKPFEEVEYLRTDPYTDGQWKTAVKKFEYLFQPAEQRVATKLRKQLSDTTANTQQLLHECSRYCELISRPIVKQILQNERQYLLSVSKDYVKDLAAQMTSDVRPDFDKYNTSQTVAEIMNLRQLELKVQRVEGISDKLLNDLHGYDELKQSTMQLTKEIREQHSDLFDSWTNEVYTKIKSNHLSLKETDPVVQFSKDKMMEVNYSPRLVVLIGEVRQLASFNYTIPESIIEVADIANKFMRHARTLEQIANFHNTIGDRMIPSQRPMMLASAVALSKLVQDQEVVTWSDIKSVEKYVNTLKHAVEKLSNENDLLTDYHNKIKEKIADLEDIDLIKQFHKWKDALKYVQNIVDQVQMKGFQNMATWKTDIDKQLATVLEKKYFQSFDTLHLYLPEIHVDLAYRNNELQFSPPEEILEEKYNQQLKRFMDLPKKLTGVSETVSGNVFVEIVERSREHLDIVNKHKNDLFKQLQTVKTHWKSWLTLDGLDTSQLKTWQQWDIQFRASKTFGQEIAKLPSTEERVGCFIVGLSWLRMDLENHNRNHWSQLTISLKDSIAQDVFKLQQYVDSSTANLHKQLLTIEQFGEADLGFSNILKEKPEMENLLEEVLQKSKTLSSWTREQVDSVNRLQTAWERLESLLENHEHIITRQIETMKITLNVTRENLMNDFQRFEAKWEQVKTHPGTDQHNVESLKAYLDKIKEKRVQWDELKQKKDTLINEYVRLNMEPPVFPIFDEVETDLKQQEDLWKPFEEFSSEMNQLMDEEWIVFRKKIYRLEEFLNKWETALTKMESPSPALQMEIEKYTQVVPVLQYLRGEYFTDKHWSEIFALLGIPQKPIDTVNLRDFLSVSERIIEEESKLQVISKKAASEIVVRQALSELELWEFQTKFALYLHTDSKRNNLMLIKDFKDILNKIGDNQSLLQSVKNSSDYEAFSERITSWEGRLIDLDRYITSLAQIQRKWLYLEPIFVSGTLSQEKGRFNRIDKDFRRIVTFIEKEIKATSLLKFPNIGSTLENLQDQLTKCQHSLDKFLVEKRKRFPRFLFLSDDDLLEIVGQSSKEHVIQSHLKKLFGGINSIKLDEDNKNINAMCSLQGETVSLNQPVDINQPVEDWLNSLVKEMQITLRSLLTRCLSEGDNADPLRYPSQILCLSNSITFTKQCEKAISDMTLVPLLGNYKSQLAHYSLLNFNKNNQSTTVRDLDVLELKLKALLVDTIHNVSVIEELISDNVAKDNDWTWRKQLRFYSDTSGNVTVKMVNAEFEYSYEYLGNQPKLVQTALTDKCFLTLTQGMHLGLGGNPYGPAGTGKTETVKALGCLLGRQVLVFNCDETIDATSMGKILFGLVQCGAWGCFDEFNRLDEVTLSTISMHIQSIQNALYHKQNTVAMLDQEVQVNKHSGIFVTLNPAGEGYGARNNLPDNLKQLFRPIVMTQPDHEDIAKTLLHCDGFKHANVLAKKIVEIYNSSNNLLSKQQHYDWGLRALKTVLISCGHYIRQYYTKGEVGEIDFEKELQFAVQSLHKNTLSRLTYADSVKFEALVKDVFPNIEIEDNGHEEFVKVLRESYKELKYQINERQVNKCVEFYEQLKQRMGVALVGPSGSGKTIVRTLVFHALNKMGIVLKQRTFNPKAINKTLLLGKIDTDTRQWVDGVLTSCCLQVISEPADTWSWIVCDGDIDPEWIESLNSVLDDNRLLSLPSGWQIKFGPNVNFVFETNNLTHASPATISRLGIVLLNDEDFTVTNYLDSILENLDDDVGDLLKHYIPEYFHKAFNWARDEGKFPLSKSNLSIVKTTLQHVYETKTKTQFLVGLLNGLGYQLCGDSRNVFTNQLFEWFGEVCPKPSHFLRYDERSDNVENYDTDLDIPFSEKHVEDVPLVKTASVNHTLDLLRKCLTPGEEKHFLLLAEHGSAKTLVIEQLIKERTDWEIATIHCSAFVTPEYVSYKLSQMCMIISKSNKRIYKPNKGSLVLYFKNLQLLKNDRWGTNILITFLQQLICYRGFYDSNLEWVEVENFVIAVSLTQTKDLSTRFTSLFNVYCIDSPSKDDLQLIFLSYMNFGLETIFQKGQRFSKSNISKLVFAMLAIYYKIQEPYSGSENQYYSFTPHDLTKWFSNIWSYKYNDEGDIESSLLETVLYEAQTIFREKLLSDEEKQKFDSLLEETFKHLGTNQESLNNINKKYYIPLRQMSVNQRRNRLVRVNKDEWSESVKKAIRQYESEEKILNVSITPELLHVSSIVAKSLSEPCGNIVLVGSSGSGRKSSAKVVSVLQAAKLVCPISSTKSSFCSDLKMAMQFAGIEDQPLYLLIEDFLLQNPEILSILNVLMQSGEVPGLFLPAELESITSGLRDDSNNSSFDGNLAQYFAQRVFNNLHFIICLEADNQELANIFQSCPALVQRCYIMWLSNWTEETMRNIPDILIDNYNETLASESNKVEKIYYFFDIHNAAEEIETSPLHYVTLIRTYIDLYNENLDKILKQQKKLQGGVSKLNEAKNVVRELKLKATEQQQILSEKQAKANSALDMISNTMKSANDQKKEMETLKQHTQEESIKLAKRKQEIEQELAEVKPLIEEARTAVGNIKSEALSEIRSLRAPPDVIRDILEGVLRLMGIQDTSWNSMKNFLSKRGIKEDIRSFDASRISPENRQAVERLMSLKKDSFNSKIAKRASVAAAPLATWVSANVRYSVVLDSIKPLEKEQYKLQKNLDNAEFQLEGLSAGLTNVDATVAKLKEQLSTYTREAAEIEISLKGAQETLDNAEGLVDKLTGEYERWQEQIERLSQDILHLPPNCLLASAFVVYLGGCSKSDRISVLNKWINILKKEYEADDFSIEKFLSSERVKLQWLTEGLSSDKLSVQNAIILLNTRLCPVVIDPSSEAVKWFTEHLKNKTVERITQNSNKFMTTLELAIRFGKLLIIEEIDTIVPVLYPIIRREFSTQGQRKLISINGKLVDYHENFSMIFVTRNTQLKLPVDIKSSINLIKFVTAQEGLEEQLLNSIIQKISPDLEKRKKELLYQQEELQEKQIQLQDQLLEDLTNSSGNILQNKDLIVSLNKTKSGSDAIVKALEESRKIQDIMQAEYDVYKEISNFGSFLYFSATDFSKINVLYSVSIKSFTRLFLNTLPPFEEDEYDINLAKNTLVQAFYNYMSRGIFKKDRITFALFLTHKLFPKEIPEEQWEIFLGKATVKRSIEHEEVPQWIPKHLSQNVVSLQLLSDFYKILKLEDQKVWEKFMQSTDCETYFPKHLKCSDFEKVLLVQCLKPERLLTVLASFIFRLTGLRSLHPEILQFAKIFKKSVENEPILIITSSGNDPSAELKTLAERTVGTQKYIEISMGEDEKDVVLTTLLEAAKLGNWLTLKNLHLVTSWLPVLCQNLQNIEYHKDFRLWLVTEYHKQFNPVLAQNCLKVVFEAPQGIKNNILRSFSKWGPAYLNKLNPTGSRIFFILTCIHALLQERRTYIPQGWSKWYEFSDSDLSTVVRLAEEIWKSQTIALVWKYLYGLCSDAIYGSRIEKKEDRKILKAYLKQYLNDECLSHRWRPLGLNTSLPSSSNYEDYIKSIQHLNNRDLAVYFGLPENIEKALEKNTSSRLVEKLKDLYIGGNTQVGEVFAKTNVNNWQKCLAPYMSLWKKLNQNYTFVKENADSLVCEGNPLEVFIAEEYKHGILLLQKIHKSFSALNSVLKGNSVPNDEDKKIVSDLQKHKTPMFWLKTWKSSEDPQDYMKNVVRKVRKLLDWKNTKPIEKFFGLAIDLSYTFHPEGFFAAFKQYYARKNKIPLDELYMKTTFSPTPDREAIILTGLLLEGGLFNGQKLTMCDSNSSNLSSSPDCQLSWETKTSKLDNYEYLNVPLYTSKRERLLTFLQVPCDPKEKEIWITAALAFFIDF